MNRRNFLRNLVIAPLAGLIGIKIGINSSVKRNKPFDFHNYYGLNDRNLDCSVTLTMDHIEALREQFYRECDRRAEYSFTNHDIGNWLR